MPKKKKVEYVRKKSKTTALVLAILFGLWSWLYTYRDDSWKFWLNLVLSLATYGIWGFVAWIWAIVDVVKKPEEYFEKYYEL